MEEEDQETVVTELREAFRLYDREGEGGVGGGKELLGVSDVGGNRV